MEPTWQTDDGSVRLFLGDCLEVLPTLPSGSFDAVIADLPYGTTNCEWDSAIPLERLWSEYLRLTVESAAIVLTAQTPFDKVLGCSNLPLLRYEWIWNKTEPTGHLNAKRMPLKAHENVLVFYRRLPTYNAIKTTGHERKTSVARRQADGSPIYGQQRGVTTYDSTDRYPVSVLTFSTDKQRCNLHPTQKPVALMEYLVRTYTNEGDLVLDNSMGSGTTGIACLRTRRQFIGIEMDADHFWKATVRFGEELDRSPLFMDGK
jgi:DNA modification methylase